MAKPVRLKRKFPKPVSHLKDEKGQHRQRTIGRPTRLALQEELDFARVMGMNKVPQQEAMAVLHCSYEQWVKYYQAEWEIGLQTLDTRASAKLVELALGHEGIYSKELRKWLVHPRLPDLAAIQHLDRTRFGRVDRRELSGKDGRPLNPDGPRQVVFYIPANGREAGANGDPTHVLREQAQAKLIEGKAKRLNGHGS